MRLFVSYASEDADSAQHVCAVLLQEGHEVFLDQKDLGVGEGFHHRIRSEIGRADMLIFLVSPGAVRSNRYAMLELETAQSQWPDATGHVIPVLLDGATPQMLPAYVRTVGAGKPTGDLGAWVAMQVEHLDRARQSYAAAVARRVATRKVVVAIGLAALLVPVVLSGVLHGDPPWPVQPIARWLGALLALGLGLGGAWLLSRRATRATMSTAAVLLMGTALTITVLYLIERGDRVTNSPHRDFISLTCTKETLRPDIYTKLEAHVGDDGGFATLHDAVEAYRWQPGNADAAGIWREDLVKGLRRRLFAKWLGVLLCWGALVGCVCLRPARVRLAPQAPRAPEGT